ncbi:MAG TPA: molybdopterin-dependent oxidoreductase [Dehalococcoidia bacterium]|nr:molybdopterin-dependent oxidoreductase [Dehalococcoidia bacterium]
MSSRSVSGTTVVKSACSLCFSCCGLLLHVKDGKLVKVEGMPEHPISKGRLCPKGASLVDFVYSPDRILYPMRREGKEWKRISWQKALDIIAEKLLDIKRNYGAHSLVITKGLTYYMGARANAQLVHRFGDVYGTPNHFMADNGCFRTGVVARMKTFGAFVCPDIERSKCVVLWGHNPHASLRHRAWWVIPAAKENGAKLIVIDPRRTPFAREADVHVQPRPGSDGALALGIMNVIISEELYDKAFVDKWTEGFDKLVNHVRAFTPEEVERITWVPAVTVVNIARMYATTKPACIVPGFETPDIRADGFAFCRSLAVLQAITGNFLVPGGLKNVPRWQEHSIRLLDKLEENCLGADRFPLWWEGASREHGEGQATMLLDTMLSEKPYPIKAMIVTGANPLSAWPNTEKVLRALKKLDLMVVMDPVMTQTAQQADIVLPAATFLEKTQMCHFHWEIHGMPYVQMRSKAIQVGESWSDAKFWIELAKRMGYAEYFPWKDELELYDYVMEPMGLTVKGLLEKPEGIMYGECDYNIEKGLQTPSGKVEIVSESLKNVGGDPLPCYCESPESPFSTPELLQEYPLVLTTGSRVPEYFHSQLRGIHQLNNLCPELTAEIHPKTATEYGINDKDMIEVRTKRGAITVKADVTEDIVPGAVNIGHGWQENNVNILTDDAPVDPVSGNPSLKAMLCRVTRI